MDVLEVVEAETLADRQQLEHGEPGFVDAGQVLGDELLERRGRRQRSGQVPDAVRVDQDAAFSRPTDQLGQHLEVAARQAGELGERVRRHRTIERPMEQGAELVVRQRFEVETDQMTVALQAGQPWRRCAPGPNGADEEDGAGDDEGDQDGDRRVIEQVEIVDEQDESVVPRQPAQLGTGGVEQRRALVVADAEIVHQRHRQQVGQGIRAGSPAVDGWPTARCDRPPGTLGPAQGLLGEAGLADAGGALQHDTTARTVAVEMADLFELGGPPREGPWRDHDPPGTRRRRPPITRITPNHATTCTRPSQTPGGVSVGRDQSAPT